MANYQLGSLQHDSNLYKHLYFQVVGSSTSLLFFVLLFQFMVSHQHITSNQEPLPQTYYQLGSLQLFTPMQFRYSHVVLLRFSLNNWSYFVTGVHFINDLTMIELIFQQHLLLYFRLFLVKVLQKSVQKIFLIYQQLPRI